MRFIEDFIGMADRLTVGQLRHLAALHDGVDATAMAAGRSEAVSVATGTGRISDLMLVEAAVRDWATRQLAVTGQESGSGMREHALVEARRLAGSALIDAAAVALFGGALSTDAQDTLGGALATVDVGSVGRG